MPVELHKTRSGLTSAAAQSLPLRELSLEHWPWQPQSLVGSPHPAGGWPQAIRIGKGNPHKAYQLPFFSTQENPAKLSDQQEAVSQSQNPYPIYAGVNVRTNISGEDFSGVWVCRHRKQAGATTGRRA